MKLIWSKDQVSTRSYKSFFAIVLLGVFQIAPSMSMAQSGHKTPKDSFLSVQVNSVADLVKEIKNNPKVQAHYVKLFHMSGAAVANYMSNNVEIGNLVKKYPHTVYCVTPNGVVFTAQETLKADERVFALRDGRPVLRWACGNPFDSTLPVPDQKTANAGVVVFTGVASHHAKAALSPSNGRKMKLHGKPISKIIVTQPSSSATHPVEKTAVYVSTLSPSAPIAPTVAGGPVDFNVAVGESVPPHLPLTPFLAAIPLVLLTTHSSLNSLPGDNTTEGSTTSGTTGGDGTTGPTITPDHSTTGGNGGEGPHGALTPEPKEGETWSIAGLFLAFGSVIGRRRKNRFARTAAKIRS